MANAGTYGGGAYKPMGTSIGKPAGIIAAGSRALLPINKSN
jgi:hypothetical protein